MLAALHDDAGQGLGEYGLILGFIAVLCIAAVSFVGAQLLGQYNSIGASYP